MKSTYLLTVFAAVALVFSLFSRADSGETRRYGSLSHNSVVPNVLFLVGEIGPDDSFELRRAMRENQIDLVVLGSPGGSLYEGLQIASILHDNSIDTYLPDGISCESSCAHIFFAGTNRLARGNLGVHQFYSGSTDASESRPADVTTSVTQYTTADIIGIMNTFDTPAFVYEKMFGTGGIYYFTEDEKARMNRGTGDLQFLDLVAGVDNFIADTPVVLQRSTPEPAPPVAEAPAASGVASPLPSSSDRLFSDIDFFGMDLSPKGVRNVSLTECESICRQTATCAAFSYVSATRWCWPKSGVENVSMALGTISGIIDYSRVNPAALNRPFVEATGADISGYDLYPHGIKNLSLDQCRDACQGDTQCRAFSWVAKKNWCFPKYGVGQIKDATGTISGIRN